MTSDGAADALRPEEKAAVPHHPLYEAQRSHPRSRHEERGHGYTRAPDRRNCDHTLPPDTTDRGKEHQDEEDSSRKCCRRKETTQGTRGSDIIFVISGEQWPSVHLLKCPLTNAKTSMICRVDLSPFAEQQTRIFSIGRRLCRRDKGGAHGVGGRLGEEFLRAQHVEPDEDKTSEAAALMVETGGAQVVEIFSPKRFAATARNPGLRPGFAMDL